MCVKVRFAPSPTGYLHIGGLRTALFNYLFAKKSLGKIILRIEDTDQDRIIENAVDKLLKTFSKLNIKFDEGPGFGGNFGPYAQSQRLSIYNKYIKKLLELEYAYPCFCSPSHLNKIRAQQSADKDIIKCLIRACKQSCMDCVKECKK